MRSRFLARHRAKENLSTGGTAFIVTLARYVEDPNKSTTPLRQPPSTVRLTFV